MIVMDSKTQLKVDIIVKVSLGKIKIKDAVKILNQSSRTIERYLQRYKIEGIAFAVHKNTNRCPINKIDTELKKQVQDLLKTKYYDFNLVHFHERLLHDEKINIKRETLRKWAHEVHHVKRAKKRRPKARKRRDRMSSPGLLLQLDGSTHKWFGEEKSCLLALIDDANSELFAEFFKSESTLSCLSLLHSFIKEKGLFKTLYVDRAGIYGGPKRCHFSQVQRACEELGIEIIFAHSPQAKGRVERAFNTLQDRLIPELRLAKINDIKRANCYLKEKFVPNYWNKILTVAPENIESEYTAVPLEINLKEVLIQKEYRKIRNDHTFSFNNSFYLIESNLKHSIAKQKIEIRIYPDNTFKAFFANTELKLKEVVEPTKSSLYGPEIQKKLDAIKLAEELKNVTEAAKKMGVSRKTIYKNRRILQVKGLMALKRTFNSNHRHKNRPSEELENKVITFSLQNPHLGQAQVSRHLKTNLNEEISPCGIRNIWLRHNMQTMKLRLEKREKFALKQAA